MASTGLILSELVMTLRKFTYNEAVSRLRSHSGLPLSAEQASSPNGALLDLLGTASSTLTIDDVIPLVEDVLLCLQSLTPHLNGDPESVDNARHLQHIDRDIAYAMSGLLSGCLQYIVQWRRQRRFNVAFIDLVEYHTFRIAYACDQLIAGDIHDLLEGADATLD